MICSSESAEYINDQSLLVLGLLNWYNDFQEKYGKRQCVIGNLDIKDLVTRVPHRPTYEKRMPFKDLKTNKVDKSEK